MLIVHSPNNNTGNTNTDNSNPHIPNSSGGTTLQSPQPREVRRSRSDLTAMANGRPVVPDIYRPMTRIQSSEPSSNPRQPAAAAPLTTECLARRDARVNVLARHPSWSSTAASSTNASDRATPRGNTPTGLDENVPPSQLTSTWHSSASVDSADALREDALRIEECNPTPLKSIMEAFDGRSTASGETTPAATPNSADDTGPADREQWHQNPLTRTASHTAAPITNQDDQYHTDLSEILYEDNSDNFQNNEPPAHTLLELAKLPTADFKEKHAENLYQIYRMLLETGHKELPAAETLAQWAEEKRLPQESIILLLKSHLRELLEINDSSQNNRHTRAKIGATVFALACGLVPAALWYYQVTNNELGDIFSKVALKELVEKVIEVVASVDSAFINGILYTWNNYYLALYASENKKNLLTTALLTAAAALPTAMFYETGVSRGLNEGFLYYFNIITSINRAFLAGRSMQSTFHFAKRLKSYFSKTFSSGSFWELPYHEQVTYLLDCRSSSAIFFSRVRDGLALAMSLFYTYGMLPDFSAGWEHITKLSLPESVATGINWASGAAILPLNFIFTLKGLWALHYSLPTISNKLSTAVSSLGFASGVVGGAMVTLKGLHETMDYLKLLNGFLVSGSMNVASTLGFATSLSKTFRDIKCFKKPNQARSTEQTPLQSFAHKLTTHLSSRTTTHLVVYKQLASMNANEREETAQKILMASFERTKDSINMVRNHEAWTASGLATTTGLGLFTTLWAMLTSGILGEIEIFSLTGEASALSEITTAGFNILGLAAAIITVLRCSALINSAFNHNSSCSSNKLSDEHTEWTALAQQARPPRGALIIAPTVAISNLFQKEDVTRVVGSINSEVNPS